jgi:mycothiol conjugate amidase Mca
VSETADTSARRTLMIVHAHPDDESLGTGATTLKYAAEGVQTVLVIATGGEEGEVHDPDLPEEEARAQLKEIREDELRRACTILNVGTLELLGYRDSGMPGTPANARPDNFQNADFDEATGRLVRLIRRHRPQVLVTYNEDGGYPHPDHIQCHKVTVAAFEAAGDADRYPEAGPAFQPVKLYAIAWSRERTRALRLALARFGLPWPFEAVARAAAKPGEEPEWGQPEDTISTSLAVGEYMPQARQALAQHRTQFAPDNVFLNLPEELRAGMRQAREYFVLLRSHVPTTRPEDDLFAGIA